MLFNAYYKNAIQVIVKSLFEPDSKKHAYSVGAIFCLFIQFSNIKIRSVLNLKGIKWHQNCSWLQTIHFAILRCSLSIVRFYPAMKSAFSTLSENNLITS